MNALRSATLAAIALCASACPALQSERWFYLSNWLSNAEDEFAAVAIATRAAAAGYNAVALACGMERCGTWDDERRARFQRFKAVCDAGGIEIIPTLWSMGYGSPLWYDFGFAEGAPARGIKMRSDGVFADFVPENPGNLLPNGGFEASQTRPNRIDGWMFIDGVGEFSSRDESVFRSGSASLKMGGLSADNPRGRAAVAFPVLPYRQYRVDMWIKTEGLLPNRAFRAMILSPEGRTISQDSPEDLPSTSDWVRFSMLFNSAECSEARLYLGVWEGRGGGFHVDDVCVTEVGLVEPLIREGTPFVVRGADGSVLREGEDYEAVKCVRFGARMDTLSQRLRIPWGSRVREGDVITVDYYHPARIERGQMSACMSDRCLDRYFAKTAADIAALCSPKRWFLDLDEIRAGGTCAACEAQNTDMAHILAGCLARQMAAVRAVRPDAEFWTWNDMFDPRHNARDGYYLCKGTYEGAGELMPECVGVVCWHGGIKRESLDYFSSRGHETLAGGYYDADELSGDREWLAECRKTPFCVGMMYTTWENKYALLEEFAGLGTWKQIRKPRPFLVALR